jgi:hypothetical protein
MIDFASFALGCAITAGFLFVLQLAEDRFKGRK